MKKQLCLIISVLLVTACTSLQSDKTIPQTLDTSDKLNTADANKTTQITTQPPPNSAAMQIAKPLGTVKGNLSVVNQDLLPSAQFSAAIDYADSMDSYSLLIWHKGALRLEHYFDGFDASLRAETASMHKSVLGLLIAAAIEDGFISDVDAGIGDYIDEWRDSPEGDITIRQLLTMSSGLSNLSREGGFNSDATKFFMGALNARETILGLRLVSQPGEHFSYANTNSQLLGLVLESATGQQYADYLSQRLWRPIGAGDASVWYFEENGFPRTYASLLARSRDWLKVGLLIKDKGNYQNKQIIAADLINAMTRPSITNPNYGWQVWLGNQYQDKRYYNDIEVGFAVPVSAPFGVEDMIYFDGFGGQRVYISNSANLIIVRTGDTRLDWDDSILPNMIIESLNQ